MALAELDILNTSSRATLAPVALRDFSQEYAGTQVENWQSYTRALLKHIDAVGLVMENFGTVLKNPERLALPRRLSRETIRSTVTLSDGTEMPHTFAVTGLKARLRTGKRGNEAYLVVGTKSRGEDEIEDLKIGREFGAFLVTSTGGVAQVTYGETNRQMPPDADINPSHITPLFLEHIQRNVQQDLKSIASNYSEKLVAATLPRRRVRIAVPIG